MQKYKILLGMSGGLDSSVAAMLLQKTGYDVVGVTFRFFEHDNNLNYIENAKTMAKHFGIEHHVIDKRNEFNELVIANFLSEYIQGNTPFPCVHCNRYIKWSALLELAKTLGCPYIATGHYCRTTQYKDFTYLEQGNDKEKDQTYFLWGMPYEAIQKVVFPLGNYQYNEVKLLAKENQLPIAEKTKNSVGPCFCPTDYRPLLKKLATENGISINKGDFIDINGNKISEHDGYPYYTIGQRKGLGLNTQHALYVKSINVATNTIMVAEKHDCLQRYLVVKDMIYRNINDFSAITIAKTQYRKQQSVCQIDWLTNNTAIVNLKQATTGLAPGQSIVFYDNERLIGGGIIENAR